MLWDILKSSTSNERIHDVLNKDGRFIKDEELVSNYFKKLIKKDNIVRLRIIDPRVNHYSIYMNYNDKDIKVLKRIYPDLEVHHDYLYYSDLVDGNIRVLSFTIYFIDKDLSIIDKHDDEFKKKKQEDRENHVLY